MPRRKVDPPIPAGKTVQVVTVAPSLQIVTPREWQRHELSHAPGPPASPEQEAELSRRLRAMRDRKREEVAEIARHTWLNVPQAVVIAGEAIFADQWVAPLNDYSRIRESAIKAHGPGHPDWDRYVERERLHQANWPWVLQWIQDCGLVEDLPKGHRGVRKDRLEAAIGSLLADRASSAENRPSTDDETRLRPSAAAREGLKQEFIKWWQMEFQEWGSYPPRDATPSRTGYRQWAEQQGLSFARVERWIPAGQRNRVGAPSKNSRK